MSDRLPTLNGLRAFEAAARHSSFTKAAAELNVTQTAVSHLIARLEDQLGVKLFRRQNRSLILTEEGQNYLPAVRGAFDQLRRATQRLGRAAGRQVLTVTTLASFAVKWLVPRLAKFLAAHPGFDVRLDTRSELIDLRRGEVDVAIRYGFGQWPGARATFLMTEDIFPVCGPQLLRGPRLLNQPADLARHTLLHVSGYREDWRTWLLAAGVPDLVPAGSLTFDLTANALQAAADGAGLALGRTTLVEADMAGGRLVAPFDLTLPADAGYYLVAAEADADLPKIKVFRDWLLQQTAKARVDRPPAAPYVVSDE